MHPDIIALDLHAQEAMDQSCRFQVAIASSAAARMAGDTSEAFLAATLAGVHLTSMMVRIDQMEEVDQTITLELAALPAEWRPYLTANGYFEEPRRVQVGACGQEGTDL